MDHRASCAVGGLSRPGNEGRHASGRVGAATGGASCEGEERIARHHRLVEKLINDGHDAERAIQVLDLYEGALELQRAYLLILKNAGGTR